MVVCVDPEWWRPKVIVEKALLAIELVASVSAAMVAGVVQTPSDTSQIAASAAVAEIPDAP
jgi:hypothetical protein